MFVKVMLSLISVMSTPPCLCSLIKCLDFSGFPYMVLYDVPMFMSLFGFGIGMMFASFHV